MIKIAYHAGFNRVTVKGHAGTAPEGEDLVCAAVSAITYTLAGNAKRIEKMGAARTVTIRLDKGDSEIQVEPVRQCKASVELIFRSICVGFELLAQEYPEAVEYDIYGKCPGVEMPQ